MATQGGLTGRREIIDDAGSRIGGLPKKQQLVTLAAERILKTCQRQD